MTLHNLVFFIFAGAAVLHFTVRWLKTRQSYLLWGILLFAGLVGSRMLRDFDEYQAAGWVLDIAALFSGYMFAIYGRREIRKEGASDPSV